MTSFSLCSISFQVSWKTVLICQFCVYLRKYLFLLPIGSLMEYRILAEWGLPSSFFPIFILQYLTLFSSHSGGFRWGVCTHPYRCSSPPSFSPDFTPPQFLSGFFSMSFVFFILMWWPKWNFCVYLSFLLFAETLRASAVLTIAPNSGGISLLWSSFFEIFSVSFSP